MRRKHYFTILVLMTMIAVSGCSTKKTVSESKTTEIKKTEATQMKEKEGKLIASLDNGISLPELKDATVNVAFSGKKDVVKDEDGNYTIRMDVYAEEIFDTVDIHTLEVGDRIIIAGNKIEVQSKKERDACILINGGFESDGYTLASNDGGTYVVVGANDQRNLYKVGSVTLPVAKEFKLIDNSDRDKEEQTLTAGELLAKATKEDIIFIPESTTAMIEDGYVTEVKKVYIP